MTILHNNSIEIEKKKTLLSYELSTRQDAIVNYLIPSICACILYKLTIAFDVGVVFRHYKDNDPFWATFTLSFMYLPAVTSYLVIVTNRNYWPIEYWRDIRNLKWFFVKFIQHLLFPVWMMWRFAERIFWSVEAVIDKDEKSVTEAKKNIDSPRAIELYIFLQAYLHALPQVLCQLHILIRHNSNIEKITKDVQVISIILNLSKAAITTTYYQRFKTQKVLGSQYPWHKQRNQKEPQNEEDEEAVILRSSLPSQNRSVIENKFRESSRLSDQYDLQPSTVQQRRRSSDIYLEPESGLSNDNIGDQVDENSDVEADFDRIVTFRCEENEEGIRKSYDEVDSTERTKEERLSKIQSWRKSITKQLSIKEIRKSHTSEPDFNISRVIYVKGLQEDDMSGKLVAFCWWFTFLLGRVLAISSFAYFFKKEALWLLGCHYILVMATLLYDVKFDTIDRKKLKVFFYFFLSFIYIFVIIEFKIKFKRAYFIYYGFFILVFFENLAMCLIWYYTELDSILNDYWFRYTFYLIIACGLLSLSTMSFYLILTKPKSVLMPKATVNPKTSGY